MQEEWKTVVVDGEVYENYMVSNLGNLKSLNYRGTGKEKIMKLTKTKDNYYRVHLTKNKKQKVCKVHRIVATAFIKNDKNLPCVDHINCVRDDNRVENLRWCSQKGNCNNEISRENYSKAKSKQVLCVETGQFFTGTHEVEYQLGIAQSNVSACCKGKLKQTGKLTFRYVEDVLFYN